MRILFLNHNVVGAGTYQRASSFARELVRRGHEVTLVTTSRTARLRARWRDADGVRVLEAPDLWRGAARNGWDPWNVVRRLRLLANRAFDLVHAFDCRPAVIVPALAVQRATGAALFMDWADWWGRGGTIAERSGWLVRTAIGPLETWLEEGFRTRARGATVISRALEERCAALGVARERILRLANGCAAPGPADAQARTRSRAELGLSADVPLVVHVGTVHAGDAALLFDALRLLRRATGQVRLALVGGYTGSVPRDLVATGALTTTGFVTRAELARWLGAASVCTIALRDNVANRGRWPGKINEYMTAGRATVMTGVGDAAHVLARSGAGWVCDATPDGLAAALTHALSPDRADEVGAAEERARQCARTTLAWPRLASALDDFYGAVLHEHTLPLSA